MKKRNSFNIVLIVVIAIIAVSMWDHYVIPYLGYLGYLVPIIACVVILILETMPRLRKFKEDSLAKESSNLEEVTEISEVVSGLFLKDIVHVTDVSEFKTRWVLYLAIIIRETSTEGGRPIPLPVSKEVSKVIDTVSTRGPEYVASMIDGFTEMSSFIDAKDAWFIKYLSDDLTIASERYTGGHYGRRE